MTTSSAITLLASHFDIQLKLIKEILKAAKSLPKLFHINLNEILRKIRRSLN
jgi:hypothetical protein